MKKFKDQKNKKRKKMYFSLKNRIKKNKNYYSDLFLSDVILHDKNTWLDGYFLSRKNKNMFYNVTFITIYTMIQDIIEDKIDIDINSDINEQYNYWLNNIENIDIDLFYGVFFEKNYLYGQGMTMIINSQYLTRENIDKSINDFLNNNEKPYKIKVLDKSKIYDNFRKINADDNNFINQINILL